MVLTRQCALKRLDKACLVGASGVKMENLELKAKQVKMFCFFLLFKRIFSNFVAYVKLKRVK